MLSDQKRKIYQHVGFILIFLLFSRLLAMFCMPLNDSTEARYGEIARLMLETGNWITPMHYYGVPFWAKPPLSTWLSAISMKWFGIHEFTVRLPSVLLSISILAMIGYIAKRQSGRAVASIAVIVLASSLFFLLDAGTVMTDPALLFSITLIFTSFWHAISQKNKIASYLFFVGIGLGLLAKGPIALVLTGLPLFLWLLKYNKWRALWQQFPWFKGMMIICLIAMPWYWLAESKTPGFLNYFLVGEHIQRFLKPGWDGDKYGFAHAAPYGMIWIYGIIGVFPWCIPSFVWLGRHFKTLPKLSQDADGWVGYLLLCTFIPLCFFTFARNIIYPYVFPSIPMFALLFAELTMRAGLLKFVQKHLLPLALITGILFIMTSALFQFMPVYVTKSHKQIIEKYQQQHPKPNSSLVYWNQKIDYSALFYSQGLAKATLDFKLLCSWLTPADNFLVLDDTQSFPFKALQYIVPKAHIDILKKHYTLYKINDLPCITG